MHILYIHQYFTTPEEGEGTRSYEFIKRLGKNVKVKRGWCSLYYGEKESVPSVLLNIDNFSLTFLLLFRLRDNIIHYIVENKKITFKNQIE